MQDREYLQQLLAHLGIERAEIEEEDRGGNRVLHIKLGEEETGMVIGPRGEMLEALQRLVNLSMRVSQGVAEDAEMNRVLLDVNGYRLRREDSVRDMALDTAKRVVETQQPITLPFLRAYERRIAHLALQESAEVETKSEGEGRDRRLTVYPKQA